MTHQNYLFKWVMPLQHMAKVKTIEILWRNSAGRHETKNSRHILLLLRESSYKREQEGKEICETRSNLHKHLLKPMVQHLEEFVERLRVPEDMKNELKFFVIPMVSEALVWLERIINRYHDHEEMFTHFIDNFSWDSSGCVDGRTMLESYLETKDTIDFKIWKLLCKYCIEDDIIRFAATIAWNNCQEFTDSPHSIYWYWKIYGEFPAKEMFSSEKEYSKFKRSCDIGDFIIQRMLRKSATSRHYSSAGISTIKYVRHQLKDEKEFQKFYFNCNVLNSPPSTTFYLLGQVEHEMWLEWIKNSPALYRFLVKWPRILLADYWMELLEGSRILPCHFVGLFEAITSTMGRWEIPNLEERHYKVLWDRAGYRTFQDLWTLFNQKFGSDEKSVGDIIFHIFEQKNITMCKAIFEGVECSQRENFFNVLGNETQKRVLKALNDVTFRTQFMKEVMVSDRDKALFQKIVENRRVNW